MEQNKLREKPFEHIGINEYGFFVRNAKDRFEGGGVSIENTFESWKNGTANQKLCWTISVEEFAIDSFIKNHNLVYPYCECILVPENSKDTIEDINSKLNLSEKAELTEYEKMQSANEEMQAQIQELRELLKVSQQKTETKRTRKTNNQQ